MAILFESDSYIELLLKTALQDNNFDFQEQYRFYTGGSFSEVKYVADFLVIYGKVKLVIECDGASYHSGIKEHRNSLMRDIWIMNRGYKICHFSSDEIKWHMDYVINSIKYELGLSATIPEKPKPKKMLISEKDFDVILYIYYLQKNQNLYCTYKFKDVSREIWSDERKKICVNVADNMFETTAIYLALCDLKKDVKINVNYCGHILNDQYNVNKTIRKNIVKLTNGDKIIQRNDLSFSFFNLNSTEPRFQGASMPIMRELRSRCRQISNDSFDRTDIPSLVFCEMSK